MKKYFNMWVYFSFLLFLCSCSNIQHEQHKDGVKERVPASAISLGYGSRCREDFQCQSQNCQNNYCGRSKSLSCRPVAFNSDSDRDCCSESCIMNRCIGNQKTCARVEQSCSSDSQCCSGYCSSQTYRCVGTIKECAIVMQSCSSDSQCCSGLCSMQNYVCLGGGNDMAQFDEFCTSDFQCESHYCDMGNLRCGH